MYPHSHHYLPLQPHAHQHLTLPPTPTKPDSFVQDTLVDGLVIHLHDLHLQLNLQLHLGSQSLPPKLHPMTKLLSPSAPPHVSPLTTSPPVHLHQHPHLQPPAHRVVAHHIHHLEVPQPSPHTPPPSISDRQPLRPTLASTYHPPRLLHSHLQPPPPSQWLPPLQPQTQPHPWQLRLVAASFAASYSSCSRADSFQPHQHYSPHVAAPWTTQLCYPLHRTVLWRRHPRAVLLLSTQRLWHTPPQPAENLHQSPPQPVAPRQVRLPAEVSISSSG